MFFFTVKTCLCALLEESTRSFSSLSAYPFLWRLLIFYQRGLSKQKSRHAPFLAILNKAADNIWGEEDDPGGLGGRSASVFGLLWHR